MLLALDIGNTNLKTGTFPLSGRSGHPASPGSITTNHQLEFNSFTSIKDLKAYLKKIEFSAAAISSVVPARTKEISKILKSDFKVSPFVISKENKFNLKIKYKTPETLGVDRLCAAEGAFKIFRESNQFKNYDKNTFIIAADFGTATTINLTGYPGEFLGGIISPGLKMMSGSLNINTAQLPEINFDSYKGIIGSDTNSSIASGIINSTLGLFERVFNHLKIEEHTKNIFTYITGGNAEYVLPYLKFDFHFEKALVLKGIKAVYDRNKN